MNTQKTILLVDDDVDFYEMQRHVLESHGFRVVYASDAEEALEMMDKEKPNLLITDLMMGSLDEGFSLSKRMKSDPRFQKVPVLIVTAIGTQRGYDFLPRSAGDLEAMHADALLEKPLSPALLLKKVEELIGASKKGKNGLVSLERGREASDRRRSL